MSLFAAQTFYIDPATVQGSTEVGITKVKLYFKAKPTATNNRSGISNPGVQIYITNCINGIPVLRSQADLRPNIPKTQEVRLNHRQELSRVTWPNINVSTTAATPTVFEFEHPVFIDTGIEYAVMVDFDGAEQFELWNAHVGDVIVGTTTPYTRTGTFTGTYYSFISSTAGTTTPTSNSGSGSLILSSSSTSSSTVPSEFTQQSSWRPLSGIILKLQMYCARYATGGVPVTSNASILANSELSNGFSNTNGPVLISNNLLQVVSPAIPMDYIIYDRDSSFTQGIYYGTKCYQDTVEYPGGTPTPLTVSVTTGSINVTANGAYTYANGTTFNNANGFHRPYPLSNPVGEYIILKSNTSVCVRQVVNVVSNTLLQVDQPVYFTNTRATFLKSPVGRLVFNDMAYAFGYLENMVILRDPNSNSTVRFVNNSILGVTVTANGTGYNNSDYITFSGYEDHGADLGGGYSATANIRTNAGGNIVTIYMSNLGCGFTNTSHIAGANVVVSNSLNLPTTGSGLTFTPAIGSIVKNEMTGDFRFFGNCRVINLQAARMAPEISVDNPLGTAFTVKHRSLYYQANSDTTSSGRAYYIDATPDEEDLTMRLFTWHNFPANAEPVFPSRSNEFIINYANGAAANGAVIGSRWANDSVLIFNFSSNNDFQMPFAEPGMLNTHLAKYVINNDYTGEETNYGNAFAKQVETKVSFDTTLTKGRRAEDILVYLTAYRPANTDIKVYARIQSSTTDSEAFDDKNWTLLEQVDGEGVYSSIDNQADLKEYTYNFPAYPNNTVLDGTVTIANVTTLAVTGAGTTFSDDLQPNDLVLVYQPLFPNTNYSVLVVNVVTDNTHLTICDPTGNVGVTGAGMAIAKIDYPLQGFNNVLNDNVVRYFTWSQSPVDGFDTFQVKLVFLSNNDQIVPKIADVRGIAVSA